MVSNLPPSYAGAPSAYPAGQYPGDEPGPLWPINQPPRRGRNKSAIIGAAAAVAVLTGAGGAYTYHRIQASDSASCTVEGAKTAVLTKKSDAEPTITVPMTTGWKHYERDDLSSNAMILDAPSIRGFIANPGAMEKGFAPNVVVTIEEYTGPPMSPEAINESDNAQIRSVGQVVSQSTSTVCGATLFRKEIVGINGAKDGSTQEGSTFLTVVESDGRTWVVGATIQTRNADNESFIAERDALGEGFHAVAAGE